MPFRSLRWRVAIPGRTAPIRTPQQQKSVVRETDDEEDCVCRFCWQVQDSEHGGELLAPCRCTGSIRYIHRRCLGAWQRTQRSQGALRKSYKCSIPVVDCLRSYDLTHGRRCDICKERYRVRRAPFSGAKVLGAKLPTMEETKDLMYGILGSPVWQTAVDVWKILVLANGFHKGIMNGVQGFESGARFGLEKIKWFLSSISTCLPILALPIYMCNSLQLPVLLLGVVSVAAIAGQFIISAIVGFYTGALVGFAHGSFQVCKNTWRLTRALCGSGAGALAVALIGVFKKSCGFLNGIVPFIQHLCVNSVLTHTVTP